MILDKFYGTIRISWAITDDNFVKIKLNKVKENFDNLNYKTKSWKNEYNVTS